LAARVLAGCASLNPVSLPEKQAEPRAETDFWRPIAEVRSGDWYQALNTGEEALLWRLRAIDSATVSIAMETFLWKPDRSGLRVLSRLLATADRGVQVRVLLDDSFTMHEDLVLHALDEHPSIEFRIYNPYAHRQDDMVLRQLFNLGDFSRVNHRMHNKALVVDGQAAIVGGRNIGDEYFGYDDSFNFRDMELLMVGAGVEQVVRHFDNYWNSGWAFPVRDVVNPSSEAPSLKDARVWIDSETGPVSEFDPAGMQSRWIEAARKGHSGMSRFYSDAPAQEDPAAASEAPNQLAGVLLDLIDGATMEVILVSAYLIPRNSRPPLSGPKARSAGAHPDQLYAFQ
jgi:putative cardiolipin synthase